MAHGSFFFCSRVCARRRWVWSPPWGAGMASLCVRRAPRLLLPPVSLEVAPLLCVQEGALSTRKIDPVCLPVAQVVGATQKVVAVSKRQAQRVAECFRAWQQPSWIPRTGHWSLAHTPAQIPSPCLCHLVARPWTPVGITATTTAFQPIAKHSPY